MPRRFRDKLTNMICYVRSCPHAFSQRSRTSAGELTTMGHLMAVWRDSFGDESPPGGWADGEAT